MNAAAQARPRPRVCFLTWRLTAGVHLCRLCWKSFLTLFSPTDIATSSVSCLKSTQSCMKDARGTTQSSCSDVVVLFSDSVVALCSKLTSVIVSLFAATYVMGWSEHFPDTRLQKAPAFDARAVRPSCCCERRSTSCLRIRVRRCATLATRRCAITCHGAKQIATSIANTTVPSGDLSPTARAESRHRNG